METLLFLPTISLAKKKKRGGIEDKKGQNKYQLIFEWPITVTTSSQ